MGRGAPPIHLPDSCWLWVCGAATAALLVITPSAAAESPPSGTTLCSGCHASDDTAGIVPSTAPNRLHSSSQLDLLQHAY
jgi:cytochrome c553